MSKQSQPYSMPFSKAYGRLLIYAWRYKRSLMLALFGMVLYSVTDTGLAALMKPLLDENLVDGEWRLYSWLVPVALVAVLFMRGLGNFLSVYHMAYVGSWVVKELRADMFSHMLQLPTSYYNKMPHGTLLSKLTFNVEKTASVSAKVLTFFVRDTLTVIGLIGWLFYLQWKFALLFLIMAPVIVWLITLSSRRLRKVSRRIQRTMGTVTDDIQQAIQGNLTIKVFGSHEIEREGFEVSSERNRKEKMRLTMVSALSAPIAVFFAGLGLAAVIYFATQDGFVETVSPGTLVSFITAVLLLFRPLRNLVRLNTIMQDGLTAAVSVFEFLDEEVEEISAPASKLKCAGQIHFKNVSLDYGGGREFALRDINLEITAGETVALVGRSGAGKSSLTQLIPRLYEPTQGVIELDGHDIASLSLAELRSVITYVPQHTIMSSGTIAKNIAAGGGYDLGAITEAARRAHALEFIEQLPQGFDTELRNNASVLSVGQRQRIAIARALFKDAPILIFDEATSALDTDSERQIQSALEEILKERTAILIAHRFSTIRQIKRIVVLERGRIVEQGTHEALIQHGGVYADLYHGHAEDDLIET